MRLIRSAAQMAAVSTRLARRGRRIGVVPTMGALHEGHASLIRAAAREADIVIVTIFVNPLQFGPTEDYARYPRRLRADLALARAAGADIVFAPSAQELYPRGFSSMVDVGALGRLWEGKARPGHFRGVATVVALLFELTRPAKAYFGQKDYQQTLIVRRLIQDLHLPVRLRVLPTVREPDGLAMSSRNRYLRPAARARAAALPQALRLARQHLRARERRTATIIAAMRQSLRTVPRLTVDYLAVADAGTLAALRRARGRVVVLAAVRLDGTRLIDNVLVDVS